jgi:hypothetical protein
MINYSRNYKNIDKLVKKYFSLDDESQKIFSKNIYNGTVADSSILSKLDNNFRIEKNLTISNLEKIDVSWAYFKMYFGEYCMYRNLKYHEYYYNLIYREKTIRVTKDVLEFYSKNSTAYVNFYGEGEVSYNLKRIQEMKLPKKKLKIVLTFNTSDMFMCSSGQDWTSCLNLESQYFGCYWLGLASLPFDKNRCMIYIAPQKNDNKEVFEVEVEKMYKRTFALIDSHDKINILKWYPNDFRLDFYIEELNNIFKEFDFKEIDSNFVSKHTIEFPKLNVKEKKVEFYIYQDKTKINEHEEKRLYFYYDKGNQSFHNSISKYGPFVNCEGGLLTLEENGDKICDYLNKEKVYCERCENYISVEDSFVYNSNVFCESCYEEIQEQNYA